jgi:hypothetical protein
LASTGKPSRYRAQKCAFSRLPDSLDAALPTGVGLVAFEEERILITILITVRRPVSGVSSAA